MGSHLHAEIIANETVPVLLGQKPAIPRQLFDAFYLSTADFGQTVTPLLLSRGGLLAEPHSIGL